MGSCEATQRGGVWAVGARAGALGCVLALCRPEGWGSHVVMSVGVGEGWKVSRPGPEDRGGAPPVS